MRNLFTQSARNATCMYAGVLCLFLFLHGCAGPGPKVDTDRQEVESRTETPTTSSTRSASKSNATGDKLVSLAQGVLGSPYKYGGSSPRGFDCSGLVYYTHNKLGIAVPRTTGQQARHAGTLQLSEVEPGDILFFKIYGNRISHVGIYAGNNQFIHAPKSGKFVSYASINDPFWRQRFVKAGRLH